MAKSTYRKRFVNAADVPEGMFAKVRSDPDASHKPTRWEFTNPLVLAQYKPRDVTESADDPTVKSYPFVALPTNPP